MNFSWISRNNHEKKLDAQIVFVYFQVLIEKMVKGGTQHVRSGQNRRETVQGFRR